MYNRLLTTEDLVDFYQEVNEEDYRTKFPHRDLWYDHDDAILKWKIGRASCRERV